MQIDGPATAEETHNDEAQTHTEDTHTTPEDAGDNQHTEQMQLDEQVDHEWDCIFSKKTTAQWESNTKCSTCHADRDRGSRMRVCERCGRLHCAARNANHQERRAKRGYHTKEKKNKKTQGGQERRRRKRRKKARPLRIQLKTKAHNHKAMTRPRWTNS